MIKLLITLFVKITFCSERSPTNASEEKISYLSLLDSYKRYFEKDFLSGIDEEILEQYSSGKRNRKFMIEFLNLMCKLDHKNISKIRKIIVVGLGFKIKYDKDKIALDQYLEEKHDKMDLVEQLLEGVSYIHSKNIVHNALGFDKLKVTDEEILVISKFYYADDLTSKINELNVPSENSEHELKVLNTERKKLFLKDIRSVGKIICKIFKIEDIDIWEKHFYFGGNSLHVVENCNLLKAILSSKLNNEALTDLICSCFHPSLDIVPSASELLDSFRRIRNSEK